MSTKHDESKRWYDPENLPEIIEDYNDEDDRYSKIEKFENDKVSSFLFNWEDTLTTMVLNKLEDNGIDVYKASSPTGKFDYKMFKCKTERVKGWDVNEAFNLLYNNAIGKTLILYKVMLKDNDIYVRYALV